MLFRLGGQLDGYGDILPVEFMLEIVSGAVDGGAIVLVVQLVFGATGEVLGDVGDVM